MAVQNILPSTQLHGADIRDTINNFGGSADNAWLNFYQANDVNKWSKWKPVKYNANFTTGNEDTPFWKGYNGMCGFTQESIIFGSVDAMITAVKAGTTFVYDPPTPTGGTTYPFRGGDWRNYNKNAKAPFWDVYAYGSFINGNNSSSVEFELVDNSSDIDKNTNLVLGDILPAGTNVANWYFGVVIVSGSKQFKKSATTSIGSGASIPEAARKFSVTLGESGVSGSYTVYPCLYQRIPQSNDSYGSVMPIPLQMAGGSTGSGISGSVVQQQPTVSFLANPYHYNAARGLVFKFTAFYAKSFENGSNQIHVTIYKLSSSGTKTNVHERDYTAAHTGTYNDGYTMEFSIQTSSPLEAGYEYYVTLSGGSSNIAVTEKAQDGGALPPE